MRIDLILNSLINNFSDHQVKQFYASSFSYLLVISTRIQKELLELNIFFSSLKM